MARRDLESFGWLIDHSWRLNNQLDPVSTSPEIDERLSTVGGHIHGAKLLGAGGGFLLMICKQECSDQTLREPGASWKPIPHM